MEPNILVVYRSGGLGDFVKTWPALRKLRNPTVVVNKVYGNLANVYLGINFRDVSKWQTCFDDSSGPPDYVEKFSEVWVYRHEYFSKGDKDIAGAISSVSENVKICFKSFSFVDCEGKEVEPNTKWERGVLFHVGAGRLRFGKGSYPSPYPSKAWSLKTSCDFAQHLESMCGLQIQLVAGPDQKDQWDKPEDDYFMSNRGIFCDNIFELTCRISVSRCFIGFDSGPTHLSAQLGKPTIALFGPTGEFGINNSHDLKNAEPHGPLVQILSPSIEIPNNAKPKMNWISPIEAAHRAKSALEHFDKLIESYK